MDASGQLPNTPKKKPEKKVFKAAVIETTQLVEAQARDIGDQRMTESKEDRSAGFFKRIATRIWKHNLAQEFYRQKEISNAKKQILETGNLYAGEAEGASSRHKEAMDAIMDRFTSEYDMEMLKEEERESKQEGSAEANAKIRDLIKEYAGNPEMSREAFVEEQTRILSAGNPEYATVGKSYSDNLFAIATEVRKSVEHGEKLATLDFDVQLTFGKARESLNTEAKMHAFDRVTEKLQNSKVGRFIANSPTILGIAAAGYSALNAVGLSLLRSNVAKIATFGGAAVLAGGIAGFKESARLERERAQHMRESAKGQKFEEDAERRAEIDKNKYDTKPAQEYIASLQEGLAKISSGKAEQGEIQSILFDLGVLEGHIRAGDELRADFIQYSRFDQVEQERTQLDLARAKLKVALRNNPDAQAMAQGDVNGWLERFSKYESQDIKETDVATKDRIFKKMKHAKVAGTVVKTVLIGAAVGAVGQEVMADVGALGHTDGLVSGWMKSAGHIFGKHPTAPTQTLEKHATIFEGLRRSLTHESPRMPFGHGTEVVIGNTHVQLPEGVEMHLNPDHTYDIVRQGEVIGHHDALSFDQNGDLTPEARGLLAKQDIFADFSHVAGHTSQVHEGSPVDYIKGTAGVHNPQVHRELWYDNDTPKPVFDKNELKEWWGGAHNTGIDKDGNYVFDMRHMMPKGSYHADQSIDAPTAIKSPGLKMLFSMSRDTQHQPFELNIGPDGNAIVPKDSEIGKLLFENVNGHAVFKGQFAEVAQSMGQAQNGAENVRILSTYVGHGLKTIPSVQTVPTTIPTVRLDVPDSWDWGPPPFIPVPLSRTPLEAGSYADSVNRSSEPTEYFDAFGPYSAYNPKQKEEFSDITKFRASTDQTAKIRQSIENDANLKSKYAHVLSRLDQLTDFDSLTPEQKKPFIDAAKDYNKRYQVNPPISDEHFISLEKNRVNRQLENILIEEAKVGGKPFESGFYDNAPMPKGIEKVEEIVVYLDDPIGDAVLTIPMIDALERYIKENSLNKKVVVVSRNKDLFSSLTEQYPGLSLYNPDEGRDYFASNKNTPRYVLNLNKEFDDYESLGLTQEDAKNPEKVFSADYSIWTEEEYPVTRGRKTRYYTLPARIARNMELMLGQKLYENINATTSYIERGKNFDTESAELKAKYGIQPNENVYVISPGSSIKVKEYAPGLWKKVITGLRAKDPNAHVLVLEDPDPTRRKDYGDMADELKAQGVAISRVNEPMSKLNTIMSMAETVFSPDTGLGHYAGALGRPSVMLMLGNPYLWSTPGAVPVVHDTAKEAYIRGENVFSPAWDDSLKRTQDGYMVQTAGHVWVGGSSISPNDVLRAADKSVKKKVT